jgi:hypothetical protein
MATKKAKTKAKTKKALTVGEALFLRWNTAIQDSFYALGGKISAKELQTAVKMLRILLDDVDWIILTIETKGRPPSKKKLLQRTRKLPIG